MRGALRAVVLCAACALAVGGCHSAPLVPPQDAASPTGGVSMSLWYANLPTLQYQYFIVLKDGTMEFGGGMIAFNRKTEWTGKLTADEGRAVRDIIDQAGWLTEAEPARKTADTPVAEFKFGASGGTRGFEILGPDPRVTALVDALQKVSNQRFERFLRRLPEAGTQFR